MKKRDEKTEKRIQTAAFQLFLTHGIDGVTIRNIADSAQCNSSMIHYYYRTKENLLYHLVDEMTAGILSLDNKKSDTVTTLQKLNQFLKFFWDWASSHRFGFDVLFADSTIKNKDYLLDLVTQRKDIVWNHYRDIVTEGIENGTFHFGQHEISFSFFSLLGTIKLYFSQQHDSEESLLFKDYFFNMMQKLLK